MKIEELPSHIRTRWESAKAFNDGKRFVSILLPIGRGGISSEALTSDEFIGQSIEQMNRNSKGFYLAWEIARLVADSLSWASEDEQSLLLDISIAAEKGELAVQKNIPGSSSLLKDWEKYQSLSHYFRIESVNDWLQKNGVQFNLPDGELNRPTLTPPKAVRRTWWEVSSAYIAQVMKAGQYGTAKELYRALEAKTGEDSPFDKGTGDNRGSLFVREIAQPLALKTIQNRFKELREIAKK